MSGFQNIPTGARGPGSAIPPRDKAAVDDRIRSMLSEFGAGASTTPVPPVVPPAAPPSTPSATQSSLVLPGAATAGILGLVVVGVVGFGAFEVVHHLHHGPAAPTVVATTAAPVALPPPPVKAAPVAAAKPVPVPPPAVPSKPEAQSAPVRGEAGTALHSLDEAEKFSTLVLRQVMTFSYSDYIQSLTDTSRNFTRDGWKHVQHSLNDSGLLASMVADKGSSKVLSMGKPQFVSFSRHGTRDLPEWTIRIRMVAELEGDDRDNVNTSIVEVHVVETAADASAQPPAPEKLGTLDDTRLSIERIDTVQQVAN